MKLRLSAALLFLFSVLIIVSCGPKKAKNDKDEPGLEDAPKDLGSEVQGMTKCVPKPSEIPYLIQATGAEYNQSLINDRRKADSYASQSDKAAMNLGGYSADIAYLSSYDKTQEAINHLNVSKGLADKLGVSATFDQKLLQEFEKNIGNKDKLAQLLDSASTKTGDLLKQGNQKLAALMVTGSFIESLYIATGIIKTYPKDMLPDDQRNRILTPVIQIIIKQECSVSEISKILSSAEQTGSVPTIVADLKQLQESYGKLGAVKDQIAKGSTKSILNDQTIADITAVVEKLRGDMVK
ncbi:MAG: hypothetical protein JST14_05200 [Bacteroidetes bacterium]|nr:hypothetical protein [Bacteroidota bacterium]MBS1977673.1 hypothetical protein [Bacteroidota bacterium]